MKILQCSTSDSGGGAARVAYRLHRALFSAGLETMLVVESANQNDAHVIKPSQGILQKVVRRIAVFAECYIKNKVYNIPQTAGFSSFAIFPYGPVKEINALDYDILHLHWISGFFSPQAIHQFRNPIVWTLHDRWPFTGGCHILQGCDAYQRNCGYCPQLGSKRGNDLSRRCWNIKNRAFLGKNFHIVCPSRQLAYEASQSSLLSKSEIVVIPNGVDTNVFQPINKKLARHLLGLPQDDLPVLLFGAVAATSDYNKGFDLLEGALMRVREKWRQPFRCLVFGSAGPVTVQHTSFGEMVYLGILHDDVALALAYNAADMFICPSREENLPTTILESMACGTPTVAFEIGGIPDMVRHGENGFVVFPYQTEKMAEYIMRFLKDKNLCKHMGEAACRDVKEYFSLSSVAKRYIELYKSIEYR